MTNVPILDLIAGMIFIYFLMSVISNAFFEVISTMTKARAKGLEEWINMALPNLAKTILDNTLINGVSKEGKSNSYLSGKNFSYAIFDAIAAQANTIPKSLADYSHMIETLKTKKSDLIPDDLMRSLQLFITEAQMASTKAGQLKTEFELYHEKVEKWFDSMMERLTGSYIRYASKITAVIALAASLALNIDSINLAQYLYSNKDDRAKLAALAYEAPHDTTYMALVKEMTDKANHPNAKDSITDIAPVVNAVKLEIKRTDSIRNSMASLIPIGWHVDAELKVFKAQHQNLSNPGLINLLFAVSKFFGLMITVFAVCLGAPFWFDILNKVANLRGSLKPDSSMSKNSKKS